MPGKSETRHNPKPVKAKPPAIKAGQTCGEAFARIFSSAHQQIAANRGVVLETDDPEGPHQLRVGLTRLRSALRALEPLAASPAFAQLEEGAQSIARAVGTLRDADVLIEDIFVPIAGRVSDDPGFSALYGALNAHRAEMQVAARRLLLDETWLHFFSSLSLWPAMLEKDPSLQLPVAEFAQRALQSRWKKTAKCGRAIKSLEPAEKHRMRRSLKKLRYLIEFFAPLYPPGEVKPFVQKLKTLQDVFGYVNDVRVAAQLHGIAAAHGAGEEASAAAAHILNEHKAKAKRAWKDASEKWRALEAGEPFWRHRA